jgi:hypothetical protein
MTGVSLSCKKLLPEDRDSIAQGAQFSRTTYDPILGRNTVYSGNFNFGFSSQPLTFEILNMKRYDGSAAPEITDSIYPVIAWKADVGRYTGEEKTFEEIENKRALENHRIFEIRKHSGQFVGWSGMDISKVLTQPDSGYVFDVKASNSGAVRYYYNLRYLPRKPVPYEPSNYNPQTGMTTGPAVTSPTNGIGLTNFTRLMDNVPMSATEVDVYFNKKGNGNSIKFKFLDSVFNVISPRLFNTTDWKNLVHGFDMRLSDTAVVYTVAYPIPLAPIPTKYTNTSGTRAETEFSFYRKGGAGQGITARLSFNFAIHEKGDWEISFHFKNSTPKFIDD